MYGLSKFVVSELDICKTFYFFQPTMLKEYNNPPPMPEDLFMVHNMSVEHGYFMIGTIGTGITIVFGPFPLRDTVEY